MTTPCLLLRDLDVIKQVMIKDFNSFTDRGIEFSDKGLGVNLFHADGDRWRVLRNRFTPVFTTGKLKNMLYLITERGNKFVQYVDQLCEKQTEQIIHTLVQKYTMATIAACAFGVDLNEDMSHTLEKIDKMVFTANYSHELDMMFPGILKTFNGSLFPRQVNEFFDNLTKTVIKERGGKPTNRRDFMDLILELRQKGNIEGKNFGDDKLNSVELTESVISAQTFVFYVAGYETSATTMAYMLYELAKNPDIQDKVISEIDEVLARHNGEISYEALSDLTYMDQTFSETLRMYPIVDPLQRNAQNDLKIPGTNVTVRKGLTVLVPVWGIHRDPKYYPNPDQFDPERFTRENEQNRHPCAYMPFGTGPRNCIGMRFAKVQSKVCIAKLLSKFRVEPSKNTLPTMKFDPRRLVVSPAGGIPLNIIRRK
ncbi:unnamed protein product, partial [Iphiclides podalirius]